MAVQVNNSAAGAVLDKGLAALDINLDDESRDCLLRYLGILRRWTRAQRLTAVEGLREMVVRHLLDSLSVAVWISGDRVIDVGSGAGLPGIPLAVAEPSRHFTLLDAQAKRCHFLFQACAELHLNNVTVVNQRVEDYRPEVLFSCVISRAFAKLPAYIAQAGHLCAADGRLLAMKGRLHKEEIEAIQMPYNVFACHRLNVPGLDAKRHLVEINRSIQSSDREDA